MIKLIYCVLLLSSQLYSDLAYLEGFSSQRMVSRVPRPPKPLMWSAKLKVDQSVILGFERSFYEEGILSLSTGVSGGLLETKCGKKDSLWVGSIYVMARLYLLKKRSFRAFMMWSPAGPSLLSKSTFSTTRYSNQFVFQDQFGVGISFDRAARFEFWAKMYHFSNGELFPINGGIDIPLQVGLALRV